MLSSVGLEVWSGALSVVFFFGVPLGVEVRFVVFSATFFNGVFVGVDEKASLIKSVKVVLLSFSEPMVLLGWSLGFL